MPAPRLVVAVDGPSGSGKSSVSRAVASRLGLAYLDTGAMYRALCWWCLDQGIDLTDLAGVAAAARALELEMVTDADTPAVRVAGVDVSAQIRTSQVSTAVSSVATNLEVRSVLGALQRRIIEAADAGVVAEGRDITTVVAPDADVRVLLVADESSRLARRARELHGSDADDAVAATHDQVVRRDRDDSTVSQFLTAADGVTVIDSSSLTLAETVEALLALVSAVRPPKARPTTRTGEGDDRREVDHSPALRVGLEEYELSDEDYALLGGEGGHDDEPGPGPLPVLAVIGRPNVGKSTLVNRILGRREAVVEDVPGVTRDRVSYPATWAGRDFTVVDTGGWERQAQGLGLAVAEQAEVAVDMADAVLFVVDATVGATNTDEAVVKLLRRKGKPVVLAANKVDDLRGEADAAALWSLGLGEPYAVSAVHGRGSGDLLDAVLEVLPEVSAVAGPLETGMRRVALLGKPNVGKSSMLNKLAGSMRVVVDPVAGTTRDPVDEIVELGGRAWQFVDTAGIRRRVHQTRGADFYASLRTQGALEKAEVAVVLVDASEPMTEQDTRIISMVVESGRALVVAYNKWDLMEDERRRYLEREIELDLVQVQWAPRVNVSARTGRHLERLVPALDRALESWDARVPTGRLNSFLGELVAAHPHPVRSGKQPRILFGTQPSTRPPRFVIFASGFLEAGYRRFIERRLRETFGFEGSPIEVSVRVREKRRR